MFRHQGLVFRGGCVFRPVDGLRVRRYEIFAHNALAGGLVTTNLDNPVEADIRARPFNLDTGVTLGVNVRTRLCGATRRRTCIPWYGDSFAAEAEPFDQVPNRTRFFRQVVGKGSLGACTIAGRTLSMTFPARSDAQFLLHGPLPGDVLIDDQTDTVFFVFSRTGTTVLAQAQNNHRASGELILPFSGTVGNLYWRSSRFYTPQHFLRADTTSGSGTLTNVGRDDGYSAWFDSEIAAGDAVTVRDTQDRWISPGNVLITARDQAAATITLASIAARTETRRRLDMLARTGPANEAAP